MKKILPLAFILPVLALTLNAGTIKLPKDSPSVSITVPDSWKPEDTDQGFLCESEDEAATILFEVASSKKIDALIDENVDWLVKDHKVVIDKASEKKTETEAGGMKWHILTYDGKDDEYGPATIILAFGDAGNDNILMVTYWVTKKGEKIHAEELSKILDSIKKVSK